jgi:transcriptional regulator with XRE-family HTH domain
MEEADKYLIKLGENIQKIRIRKGLSQKEVAQACDFETPNLHRIEAGNTNPTTKTLFKIAKALDVTVVELFKF